MNLLQLREKFVKLSGRYDLVTDSESWQDAGADWFIQEGQRYLDRKRDTDKSLGSFFKEVETGTWYITFAYCRSIKHVWINNETGRSEIEKKSLIWLRNKFNSTISQTDQGTPLYYAPAQLRAVDDTDKDSLASFFSYTMENDEIYSGIVFLPPPNENVVVEVVGNFTTPVLGSDEATNYWSLNHPMLLIHAALLMLEISYRNTEGAKDWKVAVMDTLEDIYKDVADEESSEVNEIEG